MSTERAILAAGCFWGTQELLRHVSGVRSTRTGYSGDDTTPNATYRRHGDHAEAVEVIFDPDRLSYRQLLELFFQMHDPTTRNRQGFDIGRSYRSAIFYASPEQEQVARQIIIDANASGNWRRPVVTEVVPAGAFWEAEPEHQDYLQDNPNGYTCHYIRPNWKITATIPPAHPEDAAPASEKQASKKANKRRFGLFGRGKPLAADVEEPPVPHDGGPLPIPGYGPPPVAFGEAPEQPANLVGDVPWELKTD
jgi:peptide-methionine (S)-S-oxide reductase